MQQQVAFFLSFFTITQLRQQTDRMSYEHCDNEDEELLRSCDPRIRETHTWKDSDAF